MTPFSQTFRRTLAGTLQRPSGEWRNWQTRRLQVPVSVRTWGFKSPLAHRGTANVQASSRLILALLRRASQRSFECSVGNSLLRPHPESGRPGPCTPGLPLSISLTRRGHANCAGVTSTGRKHGTWIAGSCPSCRVAGEGGQARPRLRKLAGTSIRVNRILIDSCRGDRRTTAAVGRLGRRTSKETAAGRAVSHLLDIRAVARICHPGSRAFGGREGSFQCRIGER